MSIAAGGRGWLGAAAVAGSIGLSLAAGVLDRVPWPGPNYPMYSWLASPTTATTRAVGVGADGRELPLASAVQPRGLLLHLAIDHALGAGDAPARLRRIASAMRDEH